MATDINPRDVLAHLNELGYHNISKTMLKEFILDLKKLIKYEQRSKNEHQRRSRETSDDDDDNKENVCVPKCTRKKPTQESIVSIKIRDCTTESVSRTKEQIATNSSKLNGGDLAPSNNFQRRSSSNAQRSKSRSLSESEANVTVLSDTTNTATAGTSKANSACDAECRKRGRVKFGDNFEITKPSYIIARNPVKPIKSDPVALYHKYEEEWKKLSLPGEDPRKNLRWAIRERMSGQTPWHLQSLSAAPSMESLTTKRKNIRG